MQVFCTHADKYNMKKLYTDDGVHSPPYWRITGSLMNSEKFREVFSFTYRDRMYNDNICKMW